MTKALLIATVLSPFFVLKGFADDPDFSKEEKLHNVYKTYNQSPTPETSWQAALGKAQSKSYSVQQGDTLWSLSETLFADTQFWPKLWSINSNIENPHEISPGQVVLFTPGTLSEPPKLEMGSTLDVTPVVLAPENKELMDKAKIPAPLKKYSNVIDLPESMPDWSYNNKVPGLDSFETLPRISYASSKEEFIPQLIFESQPSADGEVIENELDLGSASEFQYIYVKLNAGSEGKNFHVIRQAGIIKDSQTDRKAYIYQVQGEIEVLNKINEEKNIYRALVKKTVNPVEVGAILQKDAAPVYEAKSFDEAHPQESATQAQIISGEVNYENRTGSLGNFIFLNAGSVNNVSPGQIVPIYKKNISLLSQTVVKENRLKIGHAQIVQVSNNFSVGLVVGSSEEVRVGDLTY